MTPIFQHHSNSLTKIAGVCGIFIPVVIFTCLGLAIGSSPWFTWTHHALSDLGVEGNSAGFFNIGMIIGGVLIFVFSLGLIKVLAHKIGAYLLCLSSLALVGIGLFPETIASLHFFTSATFFIVLTFSLLVIGLTAEKNHLGKTDGILALLFGILALISTLLLLPGDGIAIPEALSCFPAFIWCLLMGIKMTTTSEQ